MFFQLIDDFSADEQQCLARSTMKLGVGLTIAVDAEGADSGYGDGKFGDSASGDVDLDDAAGHESSVALVAI